MSSSTSNSEASRAGTRRGKTALALAVAVGVLVALECATRFYLLDASKDFSRFRRYPEQASAFAGSEAVRVALVGNSATEEGVDAARLENDLSRTLNRAVRVAEFTADASNLPTWRWMIERYFWEPEQRPDLIVLPFFGRNLADGANDELGRLAQFFTTFKDWPEVMHADLDGMSDRLDFMVSAVWATHAVRDRLQQRLFTAMLPGYRDYIARRESGLQLRAPKRGATQSFDRLESLLRLADRRDTFLCFVAVPTQNSASDAAAAAPALAYLRGRSACVIDLQDQHQLGLVPHDFRDAIHLRERGRVILTEQIGKSLAPVVAQLER